MMMRQHAQLGFTMVEMIMVIVITGIIGGIVAVFLRAPIQQYLDVSRRADMTDIADTALKRVSRDLRTALPNSVRVTTVGGASFLEYLETIAGGRYNTATTPVDCLNLAVGACTDFITTGNLVNGAANTASTTLVNGGTITLNASRLVIYNQYNNSGNDCSSVKPSAYCAGGTSTITAVANTANADEDQITIAANTFPGGSSPQNRFQIVSQPVTYVCTPNGTLTRYWGYAITPAQPATIAALTTANPGAVLATNVGATCAFSYDPFVVSTSSGLVTMNLSVTEKDVNGVDETITLYNATHVSNVP